MLTSGAQYATGKVKIGDHIHKFSNEFREIGLKKAKSSTEELLNFLFKPNPLDKLNQMLQTANDHQTRLSQNLENWGLHDHIATPEADRHRAANATIRQVSTNGSAELGGEIFELSAGHGGRKKSDAIAIDYVVPLPFTKALELNPELITGFKENNLLKVYRKV